MLKQQWQYIRNFLTALKFVMYDFVINSFVLPSSMKRHVNCPTATIQHWKNV